MNLLLTRSLVKFIFLFLFFCSPAISKAQVANENVITTEGDSTQNEIENEYVITKAGDTIPCTIEKPLFGALRYTPFGEEKAIKITPETISEYYYKESDNPCVAKLLPEAKEAKFIPRLEHGAINLYEDIKSSPGMISPQGNMSGGSTYIYWYAEKSGKLYLIKRNINLFSKISKKEQNATFDQLIADDPDIFKEFKEKKDYSWEEIQLTISTYNSWSELRKKK